jgi:hypothetical protein
MRKSAVIPDIPATRPRTIAAAKGLIARIFEENNWDASECRRYLKMHGHDTDLETLSPDGVREITAAMETSRMINFAN